MSGDAVEVAHRRVGPFEVRESEVIHFDGLPGFRHARRFVLLGHDAPSPFSWLACLDDLDLCFAVADPREFFPTYKVRLPERVLTGLAGGPGELVVLAIANLATTPPRLNLAAPIVVNANRRVGVQVIVDEGAQTAVELVHTRPSASRDAGATPQTESKPQT